MGGHLYQPLQHGIGIDLKLAGHGPDAQPFGQGAHGPHQQVRRDALAMQRRAVGLLEIAATAGAIQLAPGAAVGMTVGRDIAQAEPATIRSCTRTMRINIAGAPIDYYRTKKVSTKELS